MNKKTCLRIFFFLLVFIFLVPLPSPAQRTGFSREEFINRRNTLMDKVNEGIVILFGEARYEGSSGPAPGAHFRQDNDFSYFTGNEDRNAVFVMTPRTGESFLFLPTQTPGEQRSDGANMLYDQAATEKSGITGIHELGYFDEFISRNAARHDSVFYLRFPRGTQLSVARRSMIHYNDQLSLENHRIQKLKERYPLVEMKNVNPFIDSMRVIKSPEEIEILRKAGRISAEGVKRAMTATSPGVYEYEIEAAAMHVILKNGARGAGYPPIVGSGANTCILHYAKNSRKVEEGDLILMDFGGDLDYLMVDITRTWPASGKFSQEQREAYEVVLAVQKACIESYRPGVTVEDVQRHVAETMRKKGIDVPKELAHCGPPGKPGTIGHYVGMTVHDVGPRGVPLKEGMVFAIEPALYYPEKGFGIRIEDTVLITKDGCEVLTRDVPKEIDDIENLMSKTNH